MSLFMIYITILHKNNIILDGKCYKGNWKDGKQHGEGVLTNAEGKEAKGLWEEGKR